MAKTPEFKLRYNRSAKGKAAAERYRQSEKGKAARKRYEQSEKGKARTRRYAESETGRVTRAANDARAYDQSTWRERHESQLRVRLYRARKRREARRGGQEVQSG